MKQKNAEIAFQEAKTKIEKTSYFFKTNFKKSGDKFLLKNAIRQDIIRRMELYENVFYPSWISAIKDYTLYPGDRALELRKKGLSFLTNEKQPIIRTRVDRTVQMLFGANFTIKAYPLTKASKKKADIAQSFIERCFSSARVRQNLIDVGVGAIMQGPGFARTGFMASNEKAKELKGNRKGKGSLSKIYSVFEWVSEFNIFGEPNIPFYEQRSLYYRKIIPAKEALSRMKMYGYKGGIDEITYVTKFKQPISTKDYDKVRYIKYYQKYLLSGDSFKEDDLYTVHFNNDLCEYIECYIEDKIVFMMNGYIMFDIENPSVTKKHPFKIANYTRFPGTRISDGIGTMLSGQQKLYDALRNISFDLTKFNAGPMFMLQPGISIKGHEKTLKYEPFSFLQMNGAPDANIKIFDMPKLDQSVTFMMQGIERTSDTVVPIANYNALPSVSRSGTDAQFRYEGLRDSIRPLLDSLNEMLTRTAEEWLAEAKNLLPSSFDIPFFDNKGNQERRTISLEDLKGKYSFEFDFESIRDMNKIVDRTQFTNFVNSLGRLGNDPVTQKRLINSEGLLSKGLELFNLDPSLILSDKEYKDKIIETQKQGRMIQEELMKFQNELEKEKEELSSMPNQPQQFQPPTQIDISEPTSILENFVRENANIGGTIAPTQQ